MDLNKLQYRQNKTEKFVLNFPPWSCRETIFDEIEWLSVRQLIAYHTLLAVYNIKKKKCLETLAERLLRVNQNGHIIVPNVQLSLYRNSFVFRGALLWNRLPREITQEKRQQKFKTQMRSWVLKNVQRFDD